MDPFTLLYALNVALTIIGVLAAVAFVVGVGLAAYLMHTENYEEHDHV